MSKFPTFSSYSYTTVTLTPHVLTVCVFSLLYSRGPVSISAKFDPSDNLLSAIDIKFDCETLLMSMVSLRQVQLKHYFLSLIRRRSD